MTMMQLTAFEYRTREDLDSEKYFDNYFRRYLNHNKMSNKIADLCFQIQCQIKGRGLAKYKSEDAEVGRIVCEKLA